MKEKEEEEKKKFSMLTHTTARGMVKRGTFDIVYMFKLGCTSLETLSKNYSLYFVNFFRAKLSIKYK